ncbi:hypothetical protein N7520_008481, partial [Penicillium odoratum]|uniref:uncharacterized protein n=1 Tax=Penicillium odoratum TaxID=1167516 RepID=UPI00254695B4
MAASSSSSQSRYQAFSPLLSIEPSSDVLLDSDIQSSPFTESRESYDINTRRPPATLRRVGPQRRKNWILYELYLEREFLGWWEKTEYGHKLNGDGQSQIKWSTESRHADAWKHFDQVADIDSGRPRVLCKACLTLLDHPQYKGNGTSAMSRHQKSNSCRKGKKRGSHQTLIPDSLQNHSMRESANVHKVTTFQLEEQLLKTITCLRLPFQTVENPVFQRLLNLVNSGTGVLELPSAKTLRRRLRNAVTYSICHEDTSKRYCEYLRACFTQYQQQNPELLFRTVHRSSALHSSELDRLLEPVNDYMLLEGVEHDEVDRYLRE